MKELLIKLYFYVNSGVVVINDFRNLGLGIFALYFALKLSNPLFLGGLFIISIPILFIMGWVNIHKISKVRERLSIQHGTHYGIKQFELQEKMVKLLEELNKKN